MTDPTTATQRLGALEETGEGWRLRYVRHLDRPPATAWRAFTEPDLVARWFPTTIEGELSAGSPLRYVITAYRMEPMEGAVLEIDPPHLLVLTWGPDLLRFELAEAGGGTDLTMTVLIGERGRAARDGAGWHECLDNLAMLSADDPGAVPHDTWGSVHPTYVERFGPEAATIGPPDEALRTA